MRQPLGRISLRATQPLLQKFFPNTALPCATSEGLIQVTTAKSPSSSTRTGASAPTIRLANSIGSRAVDCHASRQPLLDDRACFHALPSQRQAPLPALAQSEQAAPCSVPEDLASLLHVTRRRSSPQESTWHSWALTGHEQWSSNASPVHRPASAASPPSYPWQTPSSAASTFLPSSSLAASLSPSTCGPQVPLLHRSKRISNPPSRSLASTSLPPGATGQQRQLKIFIQSPGMLADPYKPPPPTLPFLKRWFSLEGWRRIREGVMDALRTGYAIALLRRNTKGYTRQGFYAEILHAYSKINRALAADDRTSLRHFVTETAFSTMKTQLKQRSQAGIDHADWKLGSGVPSIATLQARLVALDKNKPENSFIQVTLKINSKQVVAVYDKKGKLCGGDLNKEIEVEDVWVFERHLLQPEAQWRLCGQLAKGP